MILKTKHLTGFYKKFKKDVGGVAFTIPIFKFSPEKPTYEDLFYREGEKYKELRNRFINLSIKFMLEFKSFFQKKYKKFPRIKSTSRQDTEKIGKIKSKKMSKIAGFLKIAGIPSYGSKEFRKKMQGKRKGKPRFSYSLEVTKHKKKPRRMKRRFTSLRLSKAFYITMSYRQFRRLARIMRRKAGAFENNYLMALEGRLMTYLYRTSFLNNPFYCIKFIYNGNVLINFKSEKHYNYKLSVYKLITFSAVGKRMLYKLIVHRLQTRRFFFNVPKFIYMSYLFFYNYITRPPVRRDLVYTTSIDFTRASGYAF